MGKQQGRPRDKFLWVVVIALIVIAGLSLAAGFAAKSSDTAARQTEASTLPVIPSSVSSTVAATSTSSVTSVVASTTTSLPATTSSDTTPVTSSRKPPTSTSASTPKASSSAPSRPALQPVAAGEPQQLVVKCDSKVLVASRLSGMDYDGGEDIKPPSGDQAYWLENFGQTPRMPSTDSFFIFGHSWTQEETEVFNPISIKAFDDRRGSTTKTGIDGEKIEVQPVPSLVVSKDGKAGCTFEITTTRGAFLYEVYEAYVVPKHLFPEIADLAEYTPGRTLLATCLIDIQQGVEKDFNVVVNARLVRSTPKN